MASVPPPGPKSNLLLTLPPELRNIIYALVIPTSSYELDPTISAKQYPRARYRVFNIQHGIKVEGGTPAIAQTCREIRTEALGVHYGGNTFALIGHDSNKAKHRNALANRVTVHEWIQLLGSNAKYLRKVHLLLEVTGPNNSSFFIDRLISVLSDPKGGPPTVHSERGWENNHNQQAAREPKCTAKVITRDLKASIQKHLANANDMGDVWRAVIERSVYAVKLNGSGFDFDISEDGIAKAKARSP